MHDVATFGQSLGSFSFVFRKDSGCQALTKFVGCTVPVNNPGRGEGRFHAKLMQMPEDAALNLFADSTPFLPMSPPTPTAFLGKIGTVWTQRLSRAWGGCPGYPLACSRAVIRLP